VTKSWMSVATFVVILSLVMILHDRLPSPMGDAGLVMLQALDGSLEWLRSLFILRV